MNQKENPPGENHKHEIPAGAINDSIPKKKELLEKNHYTGMVNRNEEGEPTGYRKEVPSDVKKWSYTNWVTKHPIFLKYKDRSAWG